MCVHTTVRVCFVQEERLGLSHTFPRSLMELSELVFWSFSLSQLVSRDVALVPYCFSWWADCRPICRLQFWMALWGYLCLLLCMLKLDKVLQIRLLTLTYLNLHLNKAESKLSCSDSDTLEFHSQASCRLFSLKFYFLLFAFQNSSLLRLQLKLDMLSPGNLTVNYHILFCCVWGLVLFALFVSFSD